MLLSSAAAVTLSAESAPRSTLEFIGHPIVALLVALLFSFWSLGRPRRFSAAQLFTFTNDCLAPTATILLVIGAGGLPIAYTTHTDFSYMMNSRNV